MRERKVHYSIKYLHCFTIIFCPRKIHDLIYLHTTNKNKVTCKKCLKRLEEYK